MTRWQQKASSAFRVKFHLVHQDTSKYGSSEYNDFGDVVLSDSAAEQNKRIVLQAAKDVFLHLNSNDTLYFAIQKMKKNKMPYLKSQQIVIRIIYL